MRMIPIPNTTAHIGNDPRFDVICSARPAPPNIAMINPLLYKLILILLSDVSVYCLPVALPLPIGSCPDYILFLRLFDLLSDHPYIHSS